METGIIGGLIIAVGVLVSSSRHLSSTENDLQQAYLFAGVALTVFALGVYGVGRLIVGASSVTHSEIGFINIEVWAAVLISLSGILFSFSRKRKCRQSAAQLRNTRYRWM